MYMYAYICIYVMNILSDNILVVKTAGFFLLELFGILVYYDMAIWVFIIISNMLLGVFDIPHELFPTKGELCRTRKMERGASCGPHFLVKAGPCGSVDSSLPH